MATLPAYSPEIPYLGLIPGGVRHGTMIRINGTIPFGGNRFTINLQTGAALRPRDDSALHLSVRPTEPVIVRNHLENKVFGAEERFGGCPIYPGQPFEILILAESTAYKIAINGVHFCHFNHRFSMHRVSYIAVESDISISSITMGAEAPSAPPIPPPMPLPIHPYPPNISYPGVPPGVGHHRPHYPHYPGHGHHHHPPQGISHLPVYVPGPPPPPPYTPTPYPGHRYPYMQPRDGTATPAAAYSWQNDPNYIKRKNKNNAIKYAAATAGVGAGVGLGAFALTRAFGGGGGNEGGDDGVDGGLDAGGDVFE